MKFWIRRALTRPPWVAKANERFHAAARRRTLTEQDLANDVDAKRAEQRIAAELATAGARSVVVRFIRRLRAARR